MLRYMYHGVCFYHDRRASEDAVFALRELTRRVNANKNKSIERERLASGTRLVLCMRLL